MKKLVMYLLILIVTVESLSAQVINWDGFVNGASSYTNGIMTATITTNNINSWIDNTPGRRTSTSNPCYINPSLAFNVFFGSSLTSGNSRITLDLDFTQAQFNGTCNSVQFSIRDINSDESVGTFLDVVEISAIDGFNNPIPVGNITIGAGTINITNSGNVRIIRGHNNASETYTGSYSTTACQTIPFTVTPPAGIPLKSIRIVYRPGYGSSTSNAYYNFSGPRPAAQYISIGNLTLTPTAGCTPLPIVLENFDAQSIDAQRNLITWSTISETNNHYFTLSHSDDGHVFREIAQITGAGSTSERQVYSYFHENIPNTINYYRLNQVDFNGESEQFDVVSVDNRSARQLVRTINMMGQEVNDTYHGMVIEQYSDGTSVKILKIR